MKYNYSMEEKLFSISQIAKYFGIRASTLRYYEEIGVLKPAVRKSGRRYYGMSEAQRLTVIQMLQNTGLSLEDISQLLTDPTGLRNWRQVLTEQISALEERICCAKSAKFYLEYLLECPRTNLFSGCPFLHQEILRRMPDNLLD